MHYGLVGVSLAGGKKGSVFVGIRVSVGGTVGGSGVFVGIVGGGIGVLVAIMGKVGTIGTTPNVGVGKSVEIIAVTVTVVSRVGRSKGSIGVLTGVFVACGRLRSGDNAQTAIPQI